MKKANNLKQRVVKKVKKKKNVKSKRKINFPNITKAIKKSFRSNKVKTLNDAISIALKTAKKQKGKIKPTRIIKVPKTGGILPLIPIFAGLSALGALSGGAAGIAKAINSAKAARQQLDEAQRHNKTMESIAMGKGLFLKPYKKGLGLFLD